MSEAYDSSYSKITLIDQLIAGIPKVFRAGGATLVLRRDENGVEAIDGSCVTEDRELSRDVRLQKIMKCVAAGSGATSDEWKELVAKAGLPVRVEDGAVWVCVDGCRP